MIENPVEKVGYFKRINSSYIRIKIDLIYDVTRIRLAQS